MNLFEECKNALNAYFYVIEGVACKDVMNILNRYPLSNGYMDWSKIKYKDCESVNELLNSNIIRNDDVFVFADDSSIPIFRTKLKLIAENIYDVTALSPKLFIFNNEVILQPLFPDDRVRFAFLDMNSINKA
ncbi:CDI toxin immunity protein [Aeromonas hydrophila]|uniref:CDI toxin immunity protein n=1 Tax=Aeromonas hydrophila TaxID=644 RepID=UPI0040556439